MVAKKRAIVDDGAAIIDATPGAQEALDDYELAELPIDTTNEYSVHSGTNLPNHSTTLAGRGRFVRTGAERPIFRTKQSVYRFAAWLLRMSDELPDEQDAVTFEEVLNAVRENK